MRCYDRNEKTRTEIWNRLYGSLSSEQYIFTVSNNIVYKIEIRSDCFCGVHIFVPGAPKSLSENESSRNCIFLLISVLTNKIIRWESNKKMISNSVNLQHVMYYSDI